MHPRVYRNLEEREMSTSDPAAALAAFEEIVWNNLRKNGFPEKSVAFPIDRLYAAASEKGLSFNKVRAQLESKGVRVTLEDSRVVFADASASEESRSRPGSGDSASPTDPEGFASAAASVLDALTPEQMAEMRKTVSELGPEQLAAIRSQLESMTDSERTQLLAQMREFMGGKK
jgi:hypothetical protein